VSLCARMQPEPCYDSTKSIALHADMIDSHMNPPPAKNPIPQHAFTNITYFETEITAIGAGSPGSRLLRRSQIRSRPAPVARPYRRRFPPSLPASPEVEKILYPPYKYGLNAGLRAGLYQPSSCWVLCGTTASKCI
jgi:hypothetical protein